MKIVLINICLRSDVEKILYPVGLSYIASTIHRAGHEVSIIDMDAERMSLSELEKRLGALEFEAVGFGCIVTGYSIVKQLAGIVKKVNKDAWVIAGNSVATSIPEHLLAKNDVDIAVIGEGDRTIVELLDCLEKGGKLSKVEGIAYKEGDTVITPQRDCITDINAIPFPEWALFDVQRYLDMSHKYVSEPYPIPMEEIRAFPVNTARGCAFNCTFCYHVFKECHYRSRSAGNIIAEIAELQKRYGVNYINFWDELTFFSLKQTTSLVDAILESELKFHWTASCRGNLFKMKDLDLLKRMKQAGCVGLGYSLESANADILKSMKKKLNPLDLVEQKKALDAAGIITWTSLVIGYPQETEETIRETFDLCYDNDIYPSAGFLLPQPKTPIYKAAREKGLIVDEEKYFLDMGDRQDLRINLTSMDQERLEEVVNQHLARIRDKLKLDISDQQLMKSGKYRAKASTSGEDV